MAKRKKSKVYNWTDESHHLPIEDVYDAYRNRSAANTFEMLIRAKHPEVSVRYQERRMRIFARKGCNCIECGAKGEFYFRRDSGVLILVARKADGELVKMTIDHIIPKSRGGTNVVYNLQPMCTDCNSVKGNKLPSEEIFGKNYIHKWNVDPFVRAIKKEIILI